ncbi:MAG: hypothetical protein ABI369_14865, partial [Acetobacteraceae bacterium]
MTAEALRFFDKRWSITAAAAAGLPVPRTWIVSDDIDEFPVFYKPAEEGTGVRGVAHCHEEIPASGEETLIFQEL